MTSDGLWWVQGLFNHFRWDSDDNACVVCSFCREPVDWQDAWEYGYDGYEPEAFACEECFQEGREVASVCEPR